MIRNGACSAWKAVIAGGVPDRARDRRHRPRRRCGRRRAAGSRPAGRSGWGLTRQLAGRVDLLGEGVDRDAVRVLLGRHVGDVERGPASPAGGRRGGRSSSSSPHATSPSASARRGYRPPGASPTSVVSRPRPLVVRTVAEPSTPGPRPKAGHIEPRDARIGATLPEPRRRLSTSARSPSWYAQPRLNMWDLGVPTRPPRAGAGGVDAPGYVTYAAFHRSRVDARLRASSIPRAQRSPASARRFVCSCPFRIRGKSVYGRAVRRDADPGRGDGGDPAVARRP